MNNKNAFTLIEVSVAVAVAGVLAYFLSSLFVQSGKSLAYTTQKTNSQQIQRMLGQTLSTACSCQFIGQGIGSANIPPINNQITSGCNGNSQSGQPIVQKGSIVPSSNNLTVSDIELTNIVSTGAGASTYTGNVVVSFAPNTGANASITISAMTIPVTIQTVGGTISTCSSTAQLWVLNPANNSISYSNGNVGIASTNPQTSLDVNGGIRPGSAVTGNACSPEGTLGYDLSAHTPVYCNPSAVWASFSGWPSGHYCIIEALANACPNGFTATDPSVGNTTGGPWQAENNLIRGASSSNISFSGQSWTMNRAANGNAQLWAWCCK